MYLSALGPRLSLGSGVKTVTQFAPVPTTERGAIKQAERESNKCLIVGKHYQRIG